MRREGRGRAAGAEARIGRDLVGDDRTLVDARVAYQRLELGEVLVECAQAGNVQSVEKVAGLEIPPLAVVGARPCRHLPISRDPGAARLQIAEQVGEVNAP